MNRRGLINVYFLSREILFWSSNLVRLPVPVSLFKDLSVIWYGSFLLFCTLVFPKLCHPRYVWTQSASSYHHPCIFCRKLFRAGRFYNFFSFGHTRSYIQELKTENLFRASRFYKFFSFSYTRSYIQVFQTENWHVCQCALIVQNTVKLTYQSLYVVWKAHIKKKILKSNYKSALKSSIFSSSFWFGVKKWARFLFLLLNFHA